RSISAAMSAKAFLRKLAATTICAEKSNPCSPLTKTPEHSFRRPPSKSPRGKLSLTKIHHPPLSLLVGNWPTTELFHPWAEAGWVRCIWPKTNDCTARSRSSCYLYSSRMTPNGAGENGENFEVGAAISLFEFRAGTVREFAPYAVTRDGQRFLINA